MKITNYANIAGNYDKNKIRHEISKDQNIKKLYTVNKKDFTVLDLSCGTGNYLKKQIMEYPLPEYKIYWIGIDKSEEMIKKAREKGVNAKLIVGDAAGMPLEDRAVNYIKNRFAFHHYVEKEKAIGEMYRVLKPNGILSILNLNHEYMNYSWVYKYFPASIELDKERFPKITELYKWLESIGFKVSVSVKVDVKKFKYRDIIAEAKNKDMSQLQIITEEEYQCGLEKMEKDGETHECLMGDIALTEVHAKKQEHP